MSKKKFDGFKAAIEMLQGLDLAAQQTVISNIARQDPEMAIRLKKNIVTFDDLLYITPTMMRRLLQDIELDDLGLALRGASTELTNHLLEMFSKGMKRDIDDVLRGKPRALNDVLAAQTRIMDVVHTLVEKKEIILSKAKSEKLV